MKPKIYHAYNPTRVIIIGKKFTIIAQKDCDPVINVSICKTSNRAISKIYISENYIHCTFKQAIRNFIEENEIEEL